MKFSIITAVKNAASVIQIAIDSVLSQEYIDFEYIIIDGVSTDETVEILKRNSICDKRIRFISEPDVGIYDALNKGIDMSKGDWLYFLGADDYLHGKNVLQKVAEAILQNSSKKIFYGDVLFSNSLLCFDGEYSLSKFCHQAICHQAIFYNRGVFEQYGKYELKYKINSDYVFNMKVFTQMYDSVLYIPLVICVYNNVTGISSVCQDIDFARENFKIRYDAFRGIVPKLSLARVFYSSFLNFFLSHPWLESKEYLKYLKNDVGYLNLFIYSYKIAKMKICSRIKH